MFHKWRFLFTAVDWNIKWKTGFVSFGRLLASVLSLGSIQYNPRGSVLSQVWTLTNEILTSARLLYWCATSVGPTSWTGSVIASSPSKTYRCDNMLTPWTVEPKTHPQSKVHVNFMYCSNMFVCWQRHVPLLMCAVMIFAPSTCISGLILYKIFICFIMCVYSHVLLVCKLNQIFGNLCGALLDLQTQTTSKNGKCGFCNAMHWILYFLCYIFSNGAALQSLQFRLKTFAVLRQDTCQKEIHASWLPGAFMYSKW